MHWHFLGEGPQLVQDTIKNTVLRENNTMEKVNDQKMQNIVEGISDRYKKERHESAGRIRLLSAIAPHFKNKELKKAILCTDYELTEARKHTKLYGAGATPNSTEKVKRF